MATVSGIQNPTLDQPDQPAVGNGIQNKTAAYADGTLAGDLALLEGRVVDLENGEQNGDVTWDDIQGPVSQASGLAALTQEAWGDTTFPGVFFRHDQDDIIYWALQMPHRWDRGEVRFHLHFTPMADPAVVENIRFDGSFAWAKVGAAVPLAAGWTAITPVTVPISPGDIRKHKIAAIFSTTPASPYESDILLIKLRRPGSTDALDTYTTAKPGTGTAQANVGILMGDAHFTVNKTGTAAEIST